MSAPGRATPGDAGGSGSWTFLVAATVLWLAVLVVWPRSIPGLSAEAGLAQFVLLSTAVAVGGGVLTVVRALRDARKGGAGCFTACALLGGAGLAVMGLLFALLMASRAAELLERGPR